MTESVIIQIKDPNRFSIADQHIARIVGEQRVQKPTYYRHKETGAEFCYLAGGISWPQPPQKPGFAVVVAVHKPKTPDEKPVMRCLEEAEASTVGGVLKEVARLQKKYRAVECEDLFGTWYVTDPERMDTFTTFFNSDARKGSDCVYPVGAYDHEKPNAFERHVNQLFDSLIRDSATGKKRLYLGDCIRLKNYIQNFPHDAATKGDGRDFPAISAVGGLIHNLMMTEPWREFLKPEKTIPTVHDPLQEDYERAWWENESDDDQEYDTGELMPTCRY